MKATVLVDNIGTETLQGEWGLSFFIEYRDKKILLDAGKSGTFAENAAKLQLPLEQIDFAVLSHAHYDHADGMSTFFEKNKTAPLYLRDACKENCHKKKWLRTKYIGIQHGFLEQYTNRLIFVSGNYTITDGVHLIPHTTPGLTSIGKAEHMYLREHHRWKPDDFSHEQSLVLETENGLVIFNSCSHGGAANIIREVSAVFPGKKICSLIGGFHLHNKAVPFVRDFAKSLRTTEISSIYTGHCTGQAAFALLEAELGGIAHQLRTGLVMTF